MTTRKTNNKIVVFGSNGLLGKEFASLSGKPNGLEIIAYSKESADITDKTVVTKIISENRPNAVVNCAVVVNVDFCEKNPLTAWNVNTIGAGIIAEVIKESNLTDTKLIQISTSDIFGGSKKKYVENDLPTPVNVYGWSKCGGEQIVQQIGKNFSENFYILRAGWLYGDGRDTFIDMVVKTLKQNQLLEAINDQFNIPVWTKDIVNVALKLISEKKPNTTKIYQIGASKKEQGVTKYDIAKEVAKILKLDTSLIKKCSFKKTHSVKRPTCTVLAHSDNLETISWKKSLENYLLSRYK
ncbi:MAG: NAD-dependent epimerase/dehydratase family protein [Candidatus Taylorbacteria bacterium]|nr:NAD-dependent epimerase/dehydratase family protein [Candidatus Taylorbacteria bacterium]